MKIQDTVHTAPLSEKLPLYSLHFKMLLTSKTVIIVWQTPACLFEKFLGRPHFIKYSNCSMLIMKAKNEDVLTDLVMNCLICTCTCATYSWEMLRSGHEGIDPSVFNKVCMHISLNNNSQLTLSIKASVRLFSSYQKDVGMSKSVS